MQGRSQKEALVFRTGLLIPFFVAVLVDKHALLRIWTPQHRGWHDGFSVAGWTDRCLRTGMDVYSHGSKVIPQN